ncbi:hypothetical protein PTKIN_Ptkin11bG0023800 [Pterospermum kingtungense]
MAWKGGVARGAREDTLWVKWIYAYYLKRVSFWNVLTTNSYSWNWTQLLKLREVTSRLRKNKVSWGRLVWDSRVIPRHAIIAWMVILEKIPTFNKLKKWGLPTDDTCFLCHHAQETRYHLFFECRFSKQIWEWVLSTCGIQRTIRGWFEELKWTEQMIKGKSPLATILRIVWCAYVYYVWSERNNRIHKKVEKDGEHVLKQIIWDFRVRISNFRNFFRDSANSYVAENWVMKNTVFAFR